MTRDLSFHSLSEVLEYVRVLRDQGYEPQGQWCLAEMLDHLSIPIEAATGPAEFYYPAPVRFLLKKLFLPKILQRRRMKRGIRAPKPFIPHSRFKADENLESAMTRFEDAVQRFDSHEDEYNINPAFGRLTRREWEQLQCIHCAHHLRFLKSK